MSCLARCLLQRGYCRAGADTLTDEYEDVN